MNFTRQFNGSVSSNGKVTTTQANQKVTLSIPENESLAINAQYLVIEGFGVTGAGSIHIQLNDEQTTHEVDLNGSLIIDGMNVSHFTVVENGAQYRFHGFY